MKVQKRGVIDPRYEDQVLFQQRPFKKAMKESLAPDFSVDSVFDWSYKEGGKVKMAKPEKVKKKEKLASSLNKKSNKSFYNYQPF